MELNDHHHKRIVNYKNELLLLAHYEDYNNNKYRDTFISTNLQLLSLTELQR